MRKFVRFTIKYLAAAFAVLAVLFVVGAWWLVSKPLDSRNFTPYVQAAFSYLMPSTRAHIEQTSLVWDNQRQTIDLACKGVQIVDARGAKVASFPLLQMKLNVWSFLRGRFLPLEMKATEARVWLTRNRVRSLSLGGHIVDGDKIGSDDGIDLKPLLAEMADELSNESLRQNIDIQNVTLFIRDALSTKKAILKVPKISLNHDDKESVGSAAIEFSNNEGPIYLQASYYFDFKQKEHHAGISFQDIRPAALARQELKLRTLSVVDFPLTGRIAVAADRDLNVVDAVINIEGGEGTIVHPDLWDAPRAVRSSVIKGGFDRTKNAWVLRDVFFDFGQTKLNMTAEAKAPIKMSERWRHQRQDYAYWVKLSLKNLPMDQFGELWPKIAIPNPRIWIMDHMSKGMFTRGNITLHGNMDWSNLENTTLDTGEGDIVAKGGDVQYMDGMPPIENVDAAARYTLKKMDVDILKGHSGDLVMKPFTIIMTDFDKDTQRIKIPVKIAGPTKTVIQRLKGPPLGYADDLGLEPDDMGGDMDGTLTLDMPLLADLYLKDIDVSAKAKLYGFSSKKLVGGFPIEDGEFDFVLDDDGFKLNGPLLLRRLPLDLSWRTSFNRSAHIKEPLHQAELVGSVDGSAWDESEILPKARYKGVMPITVHYAQTDEGFSTIDCQASLRQSDLNVDFLNWHKPAGTDATLALQMDFGKGDIINFSQILLSGESLNVQGVGQLDLNSGEFVSLALDPFQVGRSNAVLNIKKPEKEGGEVKTIIDGASFDMTGILHDNSKKDADKKTKKSNAKKLAQYYSLKIKTLYNSQEGFMRNVIGWARRDYVGWDEIELKGDAQGKIPVSVSLRKKGKIRKLLIKADDFGSTLKGFGLTDGVEGGAFSIHGHSTVKEPRVIRGEMKVKAFKVTDSPFLARLFSATSPFGFLDLITGDTRFDRMKGRFSWWGDELDVRDVQAPGSVAGINLEGRIDLDSGEANLNGTVVPFSFVNSFLGSIPLLGKVITGIKGQGIIAASFKIKGPLSTSDISVNPVSLLTPGFLRSLFFASETEEKPIKGAVKKKKAKAKAVPVKQYP